MATGAAPVKSGRQLSWAWVAALAVTIPLVLVFAFGLGRNPREIPSPLLGKPAPRFTVALFSRGTFDTADYRGRVLVVNFWASWCIPCRAEAPRLQHTWERYRSRGVVVVGVNIQDEENAAREFLREFGQTFPTGMDLSGRISIDYGVYGIPETFIIDQQGRIVYKHVGEISEQILVEKIEPLLQGASRAP